VKLEGGRVKEEYRASVEHDLAEARQLIATHAYHRRDEELADAEAVLYV